MEGRERRMEAGSVAISTEPGSPPDVYGRAFQARALPESTAGMARAERAELTVTKRAPKIEQARLYERRLVRSRS